MVALFRSAAVAALAVWVVPAAAATQIHIQSAGIYAPGSLHVAALAQNSTGSGTAASEYSAAVRFTANFGSAAASPSFDFIGFCVDLFHPITVAIDGQTPLSLNYHTAALTDDRNGTLLSAAQLQQIGGLATLGFQIAAGSATDRSARLAAIQQAIWTVEYPTLSFVAAGPYASQQAFADMYVVQAPTLSGVATALYADDGSTQGFVVSGVPEPASWTLLVAGFALVGVAARRTDRLARSA